MCQVSVLSPLKRLSPVSTSPSSTTTSITFTGPTSLGPSPPPIQTSNWTQIPSQYTSLTMMVENFTSSTPASFNHLSLFFSIPPPPPPPPHLSVLPAANNFRIAFSQLVFTGSEDDDSMDVCIKVAAGRLGPGSHLNINLTTNTIAFVVDEAEARGLCIQ